jgi:hypothetical protein
MFPPYFSSHKEMHPAGWVHGKRCGEKYSGNWSYVSLEPVNNSAGSSKTHFVQTMLSLTASYKQALRLTTQCFLHIFLHIKRCTQPAGCMERDVEKNIPETGVT